MNHIAIVHFSSTGHTHRLADAVARGARRIAGTDATLHSINGTDIRGGRFENEALLQRLTEADALVFGTPTYMGGPAAQFKAFMDATAGLWFRRAWRDKLAAGFTHSGSPSGDKLSTLQYLALFAAQHGMLWIGSADLPDDSRGAAEQTNRLGSFIGVMSSTPQSANAVAMHRGDLLTAEALGERVARQLRRSTGEAAVLSHEVVASA